MTAFALRGLFSRKLRTVLTALAIVLGVATVSGTYVLTDSINKAFHSIFNESRNGSDVVISGKSAFKLSGDSGVTAPAFDESLLGQVRALTDVAQADGSVNGQAQLISKKGKAIVYGGAPNLGFSIARGNSPFNPLTLVEGSWPKAGEVVIDKATAGKEHFEIGQQIGVQATPTFLGGRPVLSVTGDIRNVKGEPVNSPALRVNLLKATVEGLKSLRQPHEVARIRGKTIAEVLPLAARPPKEPAAPPEETTSG